MGPDEKFIGTKIIEAQLLSRNDFARFKGNGVGGGEDQAGYKVVYPDGHISWSPKKAFEDAYRRTDAMNFGLAIEAMRKGHKVCRSGWNGKNMYLEIQTPDDNSKMTKSYIYICTVQGDLVPWLASQADMLSDDWTIYGKSSE